MSRFAALSISVSFLLTASCNLAMASFMLVSSWDMIMISSFSIAGEILACLNTFQGSNLNIILVEDFDRVFVIPIDNPADFIESEDFFLVKFIEEFGSYYKFFLKFV